MYFLFFILFNGYIQICNLLGTYEYYLVGKNIIKNSTKYHIHNGKKVKRKRAGLRKIKFEENLQMKLFAGLLSCILDKKVTISKKFFKCCN